MPRTKMYPDGRAQLNAIVPPNVKDAVNRLAVQQRQSTSQLVTIILEDWLSRRGELREREEATA